MANSTSGDKRADSSPLLSGLRQAWRTLRSQEGPAIPLIDAARHGDIATLARLLDEGAGINAGGAHGRTALHEAVAGGHTAAAAYLLARGADPQVSDRDGHKALAAPNTPLATLHTIRQHYHRRRTLDPASEQRASSQAREWAAELAAKGIVKISGLVPPALLTQLRGDFERFIAHIETRRANGEALYKHYDEEEHFWEKDRAFVSNNAFRFSDALVRLCCTQPLLEAAQLYLGRTPHIQRGGAMRYLPSPKTTNDMFGWHHDMEDKRFKIMLLLTGVGDGGQHMSFAEGSHTLMHPYEMFFGNACSLEYCRDRMGERPIIDAIGEAGDIFVFDSNGAHRGNRSESAAIRDVFMVEYTADSSHIWGGDLNPRVFDDLRMTGPNPFDRLMRSPKIWERPLTRKTPTWVGNLPHVERWL